MPKDSGPPCALILMADGFDETEIVLWMTLLRREGLCIKSVGLTSGLSSGAHGIWLRPDLTFADLERFLRAASISLVILPDGVGLARLEADPRVHKLLHQTVAQGGYIVTGPEGAPLPQVAGLACNGPVLVRDPTRPLEGFAQGVVRRLAKS